MRFASIDCGTNSLHLVLADIDQRGRYRILYNIRETPRLGEGVEENGALGKIPMERAIKTLQEFVRTCEKYQAENIRAVATSAVRGAKNKEDFVKKVEKETGLKLDVLDAAQEAELIAKAILDEQAFTAGNFFIFNTGGGSTEVILGGNGKPDKLLSVDLGAVRLTEKFLKSDPPKEGELTELHAYVNKNLEETLPKSIVKSTMPLEVYGSGGTLNSVASIHQSNSIGSVLAASFYKMSRDAVEDVFNQLVSLPLEERKQVKGLNAERADIAVAGTAVVRDVLRHYDLHSVLVTPKGLKMAVLIEESEKIKGGYLHALIRKAKMPVTKNDDDETRHQLHVRDLALQLFEQLKSLHKLPDNRTELLRYAGVLHDIGWMETTRGHHKASFRMIQKIRFHGFTSQEKIQIALIARYHRKAFPSKKHEVFSELPKDRKQIVRKLSALLRFADGFDRSHTQSVETLECEITSRKIICTAYASFPSALDQEGAEKKKDLLEFIFGKRVDVRLKKKS